MNAFKTILNKLYSEDNQVFAILKAENKLELAAINDLDAALSEAESVSRERYQTAYGEAINFYDEYISFKRLADEFYEKFEGFDNYYSEFKVKMDNLEEKLNSYQQLSDELGIDPNNSEIYSYGDRIFIDMELEYREQDENQSTIVNMINKANSIE
jgi:hypothetical protein